MKITGRIKGGKFIGDNPASWPIVAREHEGKAVTLEIEPLRSTRSTQANRRYFGILVPLAGHYLDSKRDGLPPLNKDQIHAVLVSAFIGQDETELGPVPMRSSKLDTKQFHEFTEKVERWLRENDYTIPEGPGAEQMVEEAMA